MCMVGVEPMFTVYVAPPENIVIAFNIGHITNRINAHHNVPGFSVPEYHYDESVDAAEEAIIDWIIDNQNGTVRQALDKMFQEGFTLEFDEEFLPGRMGELFTTASTREITFNRRSILNVGISRTTSTDADVQRRLYIRELGEVIIHELCHTLGFDHPEDQVRDFEYYTDQEHGVCTADGFLAVFGTQAPGYRSVLSFPPLPPITSLPSGLEQILQAPAHSDFFSSIISAKSAADAAPDGVIVEWRAESRQDSEYALP